MYDVLIIGRGPAGISAALYTVRANLKTLVIANGPGSLEKAERVDNYFGISQTISGRELRASGEEKARSLGVSFEADEIISIQGEGPVVLRGVRSEYRGRCLILAVGKNRKEPPVNNLGNYEGKGISHCVTCDGFFYRNKRVGVLGFNDYMAHEVGELVHVTRNVTILTHGQPLAVSGRNAPVLEGLPVETKKISVLYGKDVLEGVELEDGERIPLDGLFLAYGSPGATGLALQAGILLTGGDIVADRAQKTNIPYIFAAGDCTGGFLQASKAVGEGAVAGRSAIEYLRSHSAGA